MSQGFDSMMRGLQQAVEHSKARHKTRCCFCGLTGAHHPGCYIEGELNEKRQANRLGAAERARHRAKQNARLSAAAKSKEVL